MRTLSKIAILAITLSSTAVFAGGGGSSAKPLQGSYPVVLAHGLFGWGSSNGAPISILDYWGGMDDYLRSQGAAVLVPTVTATQSSSVRGNQLKSAILYWMAANGYSKVNVFGHSQGGLDGRYMISNLAMGSKVAVYTSISTPHKGSPIADLVKTVIPDWLKPFVGSALGALVKLVWGGSQQDALAALQALTTGGLATFNATTPNVSGVKYFSYGSYMTLPDPIQHPLMFVLQPICAAGGLFNGQGSQNDGLVPSSSQQWGTWKGGPSYGLFITGIDHLQIVNGIYSGQTWFDVQGFFLNMTTNAKNSQ
ncbi:MAG: alpha/beta fold hydrolase [Leptospirales bacterium]|nr:alpha/beta fold hydrolase [Leptospirales bacterium]